MDSLDRYSALAVWLGADTCSRIHRSRAADNSCHNPASLAYYRKKTCLTQTARSSFFVTINDQNQ
jgi:hypothetical protein